MSERLLTERLEQLSLEQKVRLLTGADFWALHDEPAIGLRRLVTSDGPAGVRGERWDEREPSANVPSPTLLAATWDEARIERLGRLLAAEARRKGVDVVLAPMVNLHRTPYGGRHFESFSEDPLLTGRIGAAYVRGLQAEGVAATVKHFVANDSETERFTLEARVPERALRELYLAPFEAIVRDAGAWTVMAAYNAVNGPTMTESPMLQEILHDEWGWDGLVMSDWTAARSTEAAGNAALDLAMPGPDGPWGDALVEAVRDGRVSEAAIDAKVLRLLRLAARVGALEASSPPGRAHARGATRRSPPSCARPPPPASCSPATTACCRCRRPTGRGARPERRGRPHARRRQRDGLPALHRLAARGPRGGRASRSRTRPACAPTRGSRRRRRSCCPAASQVRFLDAGDERARAPSTATAPPSPGSARCRRARPRSSCAPRCRRSARRARRRRHRRRPPPARRSTARSCSTGASSCRRAATSARPSCGRPSTASR